MYSRFMTGSQWSTWLWKTVLGLGCITTILLGYVLVSIVLYAPRTVYLTCRVVVQLKVG